jgi:LmbE family N-acetylglucosaminyl deacetylase
MGAAWGRLQTIAARTATDLLVPGGALVLSPHQDDETIGCGLLMAEKTRRGIPVSVAVATDGSAGWFSPAPRPAPHEIAEIRHDEWHRALDCLAVPRTHRFELGFPDGGLSDHEGELAAGIGDLLRSVRPSQVYVTASGDPHSDHRLVAQAMRHAMAQTSGTPPGAAPDDVAFASLPQVFTYRVYPVMGLWPDGYPGRVTIGAAAARFVRSTLGMAGRRPLRLRAPGSMPQKAAAIDAFSSQRRLLDGELRHVWSTSVELYWPADERGAREVKDPLDDST